MTSCHHSAASSTMTVMASAHPAERRARGCSASDAPAARSLPRVRASWDRSRDHRGRGGCSCLLRAACRPPALLRPAPARDVGRPRATVLSAVARSWCGCRLPVTGAGWPQPRGRRPRVRPALPDLPARRAPRSARRAARAHAPRPVLLTTAAGADGCPRHSGGLACGSVWPFSVQDRATQLTAGAARPCRFRRATA